MKSHRISPAVIALMAIAGGAGVFVQSAADMTRSMEVQRAMSGQLRFTPGTPVATQRNSTMAKLRDLFARRAPRPHTYGKGLSMSVAEGKRRARKVRNRQRHKKQWKASVR